MMSEGPCVEGAILTSCGNDGQPCARWSSSACAAHLTASTLPFAAWLAARLALKTSAVKVSGFPPPSTKLRIVVSSNEVPLCASQLPEACML